MCLRSRRLRQHRRRTVDPGKVLRHGFAALQDLPRRLESGTIEERKELVRVFVDGITVVPDEARLTCAYENSRPRFSNRETLPV